MGDPAVAAANRAYFAEVGALAERERDELSAEIREYLAAHPELAERIANQSRED